MLAEIRRSQVKEMGKGEVHHEYRQSLRFQESSMTSMWRFFNLGSPNGEPCIRFLAGRCPSVLQGTASQGSSGLGVHEGQIFTAALDFPLWGKPVCQGGPALPYLQLSVYHIP